MSEERLKVDDASDGEEEQPRGRESWSKLQHISAASGYAFQIIDCITQRLSMPECVWQPPQQVPVSFRVQALQLNIISAADDAAGSVDDSSSSFRKVADDDDDDDDETEEGQYSSRSRGSSRSVSRSRSRSRGSRSSSLSKSGSSRSRSLSRSGSHSTSRSRDRSRGRSRGRSSQRSRSAGSRGRKARYSRSRSRTPTQNRDSTRSAAAGGRAGGGGGSGSGGRQGRLDASGRRAAAGSGGERSRGGRRSRSPGLRSRRSRSPGYRRRPRSRSPRRGVLSLSRLPSPPMGHGRGPGFPPGGPPPHGLAPWERFGPGAPPPPPRFRGLPPPLVPGPYGPMRDDFGPLPPHFRPGGIRPRSPPPRAGGGGHPALLDRYGPPGRGPLGSVTREVTARRIPPTGRLSHPAAAGSGSPGLAAGPLGRRGSSPLPGAAAPSEKRKRGGRREQAKRERKREQQARDQQQVSGANRVPIGTAGQDAAAGAGDSDGAQPGAPALPTEDWRGNSGEYVMVDTPGGGVDKQAAATSGAAAGNDDDDDGAAEVRQLPATELVASGSKPRVRSAVVAASTPEGNAAENGRALKKQKHHEPERPRTAAAAAPYVSSVMAQRHISLSGSKVLTAEEREREREKERERERGRDRERGRGADRDREGSRQRISGASGAAAAADDRWQPGDEDGLYDHEVAAAAAAGDLLADDAAIFDEFSCVWYWRDEGAEVGPKSIRQIRRLCRGLIGQMKAEMDNLECYTKQRQPEHKLLKHLLRFGDPTAPDM
eukprot:gene5651-5890_t